MTLAAQLDQLISSVMPIDGVSIGDPADKSTWLVHHPPDATQADRDAAAVLIANFNPDDPVHAENDSDAVVDAMLDAVDGDLLSALLEQWPAMVADAQAGTFNRSTWRQKLRNRIKTLRRAKG